MGLVKRIFSDVSVRCASFMMAYYITNSVFQSFMSIYYSGELNFNNTQIGVINALLALVSIFTMQLWGRAGDRAKVRNYLLCFMCVCAGVLMTVLGFGSTYPFILVLSTLFASFYTSIQPMGDSIVLGALAEKERPFGPVRMCGGVSFAIVAMLFGYVVDAADDKKIIVYTIVGLCVLTALSSLYIPRAYRNDIGRRPAGMLTLFKDKQLVALFALMVPLQLTYGYFYAFFSPLLKEELNASNSLVGWAYFISAMSEVPFLLNSDRLYKRFGAGRLMCISAFVMTLRWFIVALTGNKYVALASQLFHCMGFIVITVTMSKHIQDTVPADMKASGQLLVSVFGFGLARAAGYFGGGVLADLMGRQQVFFICSGICLICLAVFTPYYWFKRKNV